jgi:hypothetical protein
MAALDELQRSDRRNVLHKSCQYRSYKNLEMAALPTRRQMTSFDNEYEIGRWRRYRPATR